jgi:mono/diheme cytochrome c family protein
MRIVGSSTLVALLVAVVPAWGQPAGNSESVQAGHKLAILVCANCHVAASDQPNEPILRPPAAAFESIAQRKSFDAAWLEKFLTTTHRGLDQPNGMPNPQLLDFQIKQVSDYLLSLRKD